MGAFTSSSLIAIKPWEPRHTVNIAAAAAAADDDALTKVDHYVCLSVISFIMFMASLLSGEQLLHKPPQNGIVRLPMSLA